jgi:hypothetical protein
MSEKSSKPLQFTNIEDTLNFLFREYQIFREMNSDAQAITLEYNEEIRKSINPTKSLVPLRSLYIDLCMYDQVIQQLLKTSEQRKSQDPLILLMTNKIATQHMIAKREELKESIVPDSLIESTLAECQNDEEQLKNKCIQWIPKEHKEKFERRLNKVWEKYHQKTNCWEKVMKFIIDECISLHMSSVDNFRSLFSIIECIMTYCENKK